MYIGDFRLGDTFDFKFTTVDSSGIPTTLAGSPAIAAYPGNSTTEVTGGITLTTDFDSRTGMHNVRIVASSGNGYATATNYAVVITTGTVGGNSVVGYVIGHFSIENRSAIMPTVASRTLDVSNGGEAGVDWSNVGSPTTSLNLSGTTIATVTNQLAADTIADAVLKRDWTAVSGEAARSVLNALRFLRNKWGVAGSVLTVTKEDDATTAWTSALSTDAGAEPIISSDPS